ncbi:MAG: O-phospho-L-seryl-tRNA:Cys-tRNA synthase [Chloroflexi bacterium CG23_combo_of_CG06-09_8_20_14_all_45_10]|nr:MAG: O-phospho-L-seryl-tRNA:Cys-tRNA synthase [Chloroflexi bacterium CG23_combo_of_CG06-09_8_20_14_all_45_10]
MATQEFSSFKREQKDLINLMPLQTGGILTDAAREALVEFGDGFSTCDFCLGNLCNITNPPIKKFAHELLPRFLGCDVATITHGAREAKFMVMHCLTNPGDTIIVDGNRHYTTVVAAERAELNIIEVPSSGYPEFKVNVADYIPLIEKHHPKLILLTYPDGNYGNLPDAKRLGGVAAKYNVPYILNGAYAVGRMPTSMMEIGADFIIGSAHKSMASAGPCGVLGMKKKWENILLRKSAVYKKKEVELLGCTVRGVPLITFMASFPYVKERVNHWDEQVAKAQWFSQELENLGLKQLGGKPHRHDLLHFDAPAFYEISQHVPERGYFLYKELKKRGIWGPQPGLAKSFKVSTFAASKEQLGFVIDSFKDILQKHHSKAV